FFELMPGDLLFLGPHPLSTLHVTARGAVTRRPGPLPPALDWLVRHSRLALAALVRSDRHRANPHFAHKDILRRVDPVLLADLEHLFTNLARVTREHGVPVTVLLIPTYHQVTREGVGTGFQDA